MYTNTIRLMKHVMTITIIGLFPLYGTAQADTRTIDANLPLTKLTNDVHVLHAPNESPDKTNKGHVSNSIFVKTDKGMVIIDTGGSVYVGEMLVKMAKTLSDKPVIAVFNTHDHADHWLGNHGIIKHYSTVDIYAHPKMISRLKSGDDAMWIRQMNERTEGMIEGTNAVIANKAVNHGDEVKIGNKTFRIYHVENGHSDNDIVIEIVEDKVVVFGDVLRNENLSMFMGSYKGNLAALDMGLKTGATMFVPGHGQSGDKAIVEKYRDFIVALKAEIKKHYKAGLADYEMKPKVVESMRGYKDWANFDDNIGRLIGFAYVEVENEAF